MSAKRGGERERRGGREAGARGDASGDVERVRLADVALPIPLPRALSYLVPDERSRHRRSRAAACSARSARGASSAS